MKNTFYLTTAIPYVNAAPHLGHVLEFIQTDVIARYQRSCGKEVALVTGADENSLKNVHAAEKQGITVAELCSRNSAVFMQIAQKVGLSFTTFRRTSDKEKHWPGPQKLWQLCDKAGDIYKKKYRGLYCVGCEAFYEEDELNDGICPEHRTTPEIVEEENYFFKLSKYQKKLDEMIESDELMIVPETRKNEVLSFIRSGLRDFSVSRSNKRARGWGVPVPNDPAQIQYVWFDALSTYLTGIGYGTDEKEFEKFWPADVHVIGKGILRFHAVYWPAMLLSAGLAAPKKIFVHGYITIDGQKMSKSIGNIIDPAIIIEKYGSDVLRYYLIGEVPTFEDGDFSEKNLMEMSNSELLANLGNLVNRTLVFLKNNYEGKVPQGEPNEADKKFLDDQKALAATITEELEKVKLKDALHKTMSFSKNANKYFQDNKPWELVKKDKARADTVMGILACQIYNLSILIEPYLPATSAEIKKQMNLPDSKWADIGKPLPAGHQIGEPKPLFRKIEPKEIEALKAKFAGKKEEAAKAMSFSDIDLEVGQILSVEKHPDAEKLLVEKIKLGDGERQIVSGLAAYYLPEELIGKKVVVVKNLATAKLRGVESQGMVLAAEGHERSPPKDGKFETEDALEVIFCHESSVGDKVLQEGGKSAPRNTITINEFRKIKIEVKDFAVVSEGKQLGAGGNLLRMKDTKEGEVC